MLKIELTVTRLCIGCLGLATKHTPLRRPWTTIGLHWFSHRGVYIKHGTSVWAGSGLISQCNLPRSKPGIHATRNITKGVSPKLETMKLDTPEFKKLFTPELVKLTELFQKYNYELRIAGGAVRDLFLGKQPHDVDFATTATPTEMKEMFEAEGIRMFNNKGEKHGTITCRINDKENFEVTTLRIDVTTDGRHAEVEFTQDWQLDALRRDLTINSMFLGFDGTLYDYFRGTDDLKERKICFVGSAVDRIREDYLRILRYFRFYGRIARDSDNHDPATLDAIRANMDGLAGISGERIWVELKKIVAGKGAGSLMRVMVELGMAPFVGLPENADLNEFDRIYSRCHDLEPLPLTLLPALMKGEQEILKLNQRLKMSREEIRLGTFIIHHREDDFGPDPFRHCQNILCDTAAKEPKAKERISELLKYLDLRETLQQFSSWQHPKFPVNGIKLLEMGVKKGPALAKTLDALREKWKESAFQFTEEELLGFVEEIKKQQSKKD